MIEEGETKEAELKKALITDYFMAYGKPCISILDVNLTYYCIISFF